MPDFDFGTVLSVVKHVLQAVEGGNSKSPQVCGCGCSCGSQNSGTTPDYVLTGLPVAIDTLIFKKIGLGGDLNANQVESLLSLFTDLDGYLHQFITMLTSIKQKLPANDAQDTNKQERRKMVEELLTLIDKWSTRRQGGLLKTYLVSGVGNEPPPSPTPKY